MSQKVNKGFGGNYQKKIIRSTKTYPRSTDNDEIKKSKYQKKLDGLSKGRKTRIENLEKAKIEKNRKKTEDEELDELNTIKENKELKSKQIFGKKKTFQNINDKLIKQFGTDFIQVLPSKLKIGKYNDFRIIISPNQYSRYRSFTKSNIKQFGKSINELLKENGVKKAEINLDLNYDGVVRSSSYELDEGVKFYDYFDYSPSDKDLEAAEYFKNINKFTDSVNFIVSVKKT
jgi:hypothetical protein